MELKTENLTYEKVSELKKYSDFLKKHYFEYDFDYKTFADIVHDLIDNDEFKYTGRTIVEQENCLYYVFKDTEILFSGNFHYIRGKMMGEYATNSIPITLVNIWIPKEKELTEIELVKKDILGTKKELAEIKDLLKKMVV